MTKRHLEDQQRLKNLEQTCGERWYFCDNNGFLATAAFQKYEETAYGIPESHELIFSLRCCDNRANL